jgi:hypothetical protein
MLQETTHPSRMEVAAKNKRVAVRKRYTHMLTTGTIPPLVYNNWIPDSRKLTRVPKLNPSLFASGIGKDAALSFADRDQYDQQFRDPNWIKDSG